MIPSPEPSETWTNVKHRDDYTILALATDATNERVGIPVVVYQACKLPREIYVRELGEFKQKFVQKGTTI